MGKTLDWILKQSSDELAAESSRGRGGITNWLLKQALDELSARSSRDTDIKSIRGSYWTHDFKSYEDAISHLDRLKAKYAKEPPREMRNALDDAYRQAKSYFGKE